MGLLGAVGTLVTAPVKVVKVTGKVAVGAGKVAVGTGKAVATTTKLVAAPVIVTGKVGYQAGKAGYKTAKVGYKVLKVGGKVVYFVTKTGLQVSVITVTVVGKTAMVGWKVCHGVWVTARVCRYAVQLYLKVRSTTVGRFFLCRLERLALEVAMVATGPGAVFAILMELGNICDAVSTITQFVQPVYSAVSNVSSKMPSSLTADYKRIESGSLDPDSKKALKAIQNRPEATDDTLFEEAHSLHKLLEEEVPEPGQVPDKKKSKNAQKNGKKKDKNQQANWSILGEYMDHAELAAVCDIMKHTYSEAGVSASFTDDVVQWIKAESGTEGVANPVALDFSTLPTFEEANQEDPELEQAVQEYAEEQAHARIEGAVDQRVEQQIDATVEPLLNRAHDKQPPPQQLQMAGGPAAFPQHVVPVMPGGVSTPSDVVNQITNANQTGGIFVLPVQGNHPKVSSCGTSMNTFLWCLSLNGETNIVFLHPLICMFRCIKDTTALSEVVTKYIELSTPMGVDSLRGRITALDIRMRAPGEIREGDNLCMGFCSCCGATFSQNRTFERTVGGQVFKINITNTTRKSGGLIHNSFSVYEVAMTINGTKYV